jgi:hypothetical protein
MFVFTRAFWTAVILGGVFVVASCASEAHTLKPGECVAYASDSERFAVLKSQGWSIDNADEGLRKMLADGRWFMYVQDKEDVERIRNTVHSIWNLDDDIAPHVVREAILMKCDPDNDEQYQLMFEPPKYHGA